MRKLISVKYNNTSFNIAILLLRITAGGLLMHHGYYKLVNFGGLKNKFMNFLGMGSTLSLTFATFAEFFCALFVLLGLFTRLAAIPVIITMCVALFKANNGDFFGDGEMAALYLGAYLVLLFVGPGRISIDSMFGK